MRPKWHPEDLNETPFGARDGVKPVPATPLKSGRCIAKETQMQTPFRVVIFSGADAGHILQLVKRIHREVPEARVCGVLCERRPAKPLSKRATGFVRNLKQRGFIRYASLKIARSIRQQASKAGTAFLHFVHGGSPAPSPAVDPLQIFESLNCPFQITTDYHSEQSLAFVRSLQPDLGIVYGTRILKPSLFSIPRLGSINIHKRKVPDYRGGGAVGLWELLDGQTEIGVTVHEVTEKLDAGAVVNSATIPIEPFDSLTSLALKAHVVGNDLLVRSVADVARGTLNLTSQPGTGRMFKSPSAPQLLQYERQLAACRSAYKPSGSRPLPKMIAKTLLGLPSVTIRNWGRRLRGNFPVTILFHHIVADRPHRMGISTEYFLKHVEFLRKHYEIVSLRQAIAMLKANDVKRPTVVLTFDDGYRDNYINLRAVVEETGIPVTMFISSDHISREAEFKHDLEFDSPGFLPLTWGQLKQMQRDGFEIGSHTRTHFDCASDDIAALENELVGSREDLEASLGERVEFFSFPFGLPENISPEAATIAARTYEYVLSAFGGDSAKLNDGDVKHLRRWCHPNRLWDLELQIQGALEPAPSFELPAAALETHTPKTGASEPIHNSL